MAACLRLHVLELRLLLQGLTGGQAEGCCLLAACLVSSGAGLQMSRQG